MSSDPRQSIAFHRAANDLMLLSVVFAAYLLFALIIPALDVEPDSLSISVAISTYRPVLLMFFASCAIPLAILGWRASPAPGCFGIAAVVRSNRDTGEKTMHALRLRLSRLCLGLPLAQVLAAVALANALAPASARAQEIKIGGTGGALATIQMLADAYRKTHPETKFTVLPSLGSGGGIKAVLAGAIQIAVSARPLETSEASRGASAFEYGRTPFVFAAAASRPGSGLGLKDLADIYAGRTDRWPDGTRIRLVLRPIGDSDSDMIKGMSPALREALGEAEKRKGTAFAVTDQDAADGLEKIQGALGPTTLAQILAEGRALKAFSLDGIEPSVDALADGRYPYHKRLFLVTAAKPPPMAREFVAFVKSATARGILARTGHWVK